MTKTEVLRPYSAKPDLRLTLARLLDQRAVAEGRGIPTQSVFLTPEEGAAAELLLARLPMQKHLFSGGFSGAERQICAFLPEWMSEDDWFSDDDCPLCALSISVPAMAELSHRDYLGSLMALGISREKFGDILQTEDGAQLILLRELLPLVESQWEKVGRYPLTLSRLSLSELCPKEVKRKLVRDTVPSLRLDNVVASGFSLSRTRAAELIEQGRILRNHRPSEKTDQAVLEGDVFSCRGMGKFVLGRAEGKSKKGRIIIEIERYE